MTLMFQSEVFHIQNDFQVQTHKLIAFIYIYLILLIVCGLIQIENNFQVQTHRLMEPHVCTLKTSSCEIDEPTCLYTQNQFLQGMH